MIRLGHTRIGFIHYRELTRLDVGGRFGGYRKSLDDAELVFDDVLVRSGNYDAGSGFHAMRSLLGLSTNPSAVMTGNDTIAIGAIAAVADAGLSVPKDVAVVGFDDIPIGKFLVPPLTTIRVPVAEMAEQAGEMVIRLIRDELLEEHRVRFPTELVVRSSCGER
jgi:DNA-binding LacI/PurR family transcriptional regulator